MMMYLLTDGFSGTNFKPFDGTEISASDSGRSGGMQWTNLGHGQWDVISVEFLDKTLPEWSWWQDVVLVLSAMVEVLEVCSHRSGELEFIIIGVVLGRTRASYFKVAHNTKTEEPFDWKSQSMKSPFSPFKMFSLFLVRQHCIFVISE